MPRLAVLVAGRSAADVVVYLCPPIESSWAKSSPVTFYML